MIANSSYGDRISFLLRIDLGFYDAGLWGGDRRAFRSAGVPENGEAFVHPVFFHLFCQSESSLTRLARSKNEGNIWSLTAVQVATCER